MINIQQLGCTVIKKAVLYFVQDIYSAGQN